MALGPGIRLGAYEILTLIGSGGMGEVYRARDTKLEREVALKILPATFSADPERVARFRREAQVLASLNHPHIAQIHGLDESEGTQFLVLELVDGESLDKRIARGRIPVDEAIGIARQIAEALEAAHEKGIVHRDLKPANIAVTTDGSVKVLDFGLAKAVETTSGSVEAMNSPTITTPAMMTGVGVILGTASYMSPEQVRGRAADKRTDVWAFGCVVFEMLTGVRALPGDEIPDVLATVRRAEPDWAALPPAVPPSVRRMLRQCLQKDPNARIRNVAIARFLLDDVDPSGAVTRTAAPRPGRILAFGAGLVLVGIAAGLTVGLLRPSIVAKEKPIRFAVVPQSSATFLSASSPYRDLVLFPDGTRIAYSEATRPTDSRIFVHDASRLDNEQDTVPVSGVAPFASPDGAWLGFFSPGTLELRKVPVSGGPPTSICRITGGLNGTSWGDDNRIVFSTTDLATGLLSVSAAGGEPAVLTKPDTDRGELDHVGPSRINQVT